MKLLATKILTGQIHVLTGLHIGAGKDAIEIGGIDSPVVKNPYTAEPYIPGSSLKGKLRCLMEWATNRVHPKGTPWDGGTEQDSENWRKTRYSEFSGQPIRRGMEARPA